MNYFNVACAPLWLSTVHHTDYNEHGKARDLCSFNAASMLYAPLRFFNAKFAANQTCTYGND